VRLELLFGAVCMSVLDGAAWFQMAWSECVSFDAEGIQFYLSRKEQNYCLRIPFFWFASHQVSQHRISVKNSFTESSYFYRLFNLITDKLISSCYY